MPRSLAAFILIAILAPALLVGQGTYGRRPQRGTDGISIYDVPAVTFRGKVKTLTKKELRIDLESEDQSMTFRLTRKTHFLKDGKEVKPSDVAVGTVLAVDATREPDQKFSALNIIVSPPKPKTADQ